MVELAQCRDLLYREEMRVLFPLFPTPNHAVDIHRVVSRLIFLTTCLPVCRTFPARLPLQTLALRVLVALCLLDVLVRPPRVQHVSLLLNRACLLVRLGAALAECARL